MVSPCRIELESPLSAGLAVIGSAAVHDPEIFGDEQRFTHDDPRLAMRRRLERGIDGLTQQAEQIAHPQAALVGLVDEAMDLIEGRHHIEVQDGKREDLAGPPQPAVNEQVDGERQDHQVEKPLVDRLAGAEERHLEVMTQLFGASVLGDPLDSLGLLAVGIGRPDVVDARRAARRPCRRFALDCASRSSRMPFWVMSCQIVRPSETGITPAIASAILGCLASVADSANAPIKQRRHEIQEADPQESNHAVHTPRDSPVQCPNLILRQHGEVDLQQVRDNADRHVAVDACASVLDEKPAQHIHHFTHEVSATDDAQIHGGDVSELGL